MEVYPTVFCSCGWLMSSTEAGLTYYCENPACPQRTKLFEIEITFKVHTVPNKII